MKLLRANKAVTAIEFALLAPVFFLVFYGIIEIGLTMFFDSTLNSALRNAARQGVTNGYSSSADIRNVMDDFMAGTYRNSPDMVLAVKVIQPPTVNSDGKISTFEAKREITDLKKISTDFLANPDSFFTTADDFTASKPAQSGALVVYMAKYKWGGVTQLVGKFLPANLYAVTIVRNEAF